MAEWLATKGHLVTVVTAPPYYPAWQVSPGYKSRLWHKETINNVRVHRCPIYVPEAPSGITRALHLLSFSFSSLAPMLHAALREKPDAVICIAPSIVGSPISLLAAKIAGATSWLHIQDYEIDAAFNMSVMEGEFKKRLFMKLEQVILTSFDQISSISPAMVERAKSKGVATDRVVEIRNWVDADTIYPLKDRSPYRKIWGISDDDIVALYSGNMGTKQGLEIIVEAARQIEPNRHIKFVVCGDGPAKSLLMSLARGLSNLQFHPLQPSEALNDLLNAADIHLLPQRPGASDIVLPSKLTGMLASGRPVVATAPKTSDLAKEIGHAGITVPYERLDLFTGAIRDLADSTNRRLELGRAARMCAVKHWSKNSILNLLEQSLIIAIRTRTSRKRQPTNTKEP